MIPFLAILTIGLKKPKQTVGEEPTATGSEGATLSKETAESPAELSSPPYRGTQDRNGLDAAKARDFQLSARLAVTARLNRPKTVVVISARKARAHVKASPASHMSGRLVVRNMRPATDPASIHEFPSPQHAPDIVPITAAA
jgi:hypothetical protein